MVHHLKLACLLMASFVASTWTQSATAQPDTAAENKDGRPSCWLIAPDDYRQMLAHSLADRAKLLETTIFLSGHPPDLLDHVLSDVYKPYHWTRTTSRQGRSLLMLDDNYRYKSLTTLSIGVASLEVNVTDKPARCIGGRDQETTLTIIRESFFRDFAEPNPSLNDLKGSFGLEDHICNVQIVRNGDYADFTYRCCQSVFGRGLSCHDLQQDDWVSFLLSLIIIIKVLVVLYSPLFLPDSLYRMKYVAGQYIYRVPETAPLTLKVAVTQNPDQFGEMNRSKTVRLSNLKNMEYFKAMVSNSSWIPDTVYELQIPNVRLSVKARRLLDSCCVPVTLTGLLYKYFLRCHLRRIEPLKECCSSDILGKFNPGFKVVTWHRCLKIVARICLFAMLATPWIIQTIFYVKYEAALIHNKTRAAQDRGLKLKLPPSVLIHMTPLHGLFIVVYVIFIIDSIIYGVVSSGIKEKFKYVARQCLRNMREGSRVTVLAWATRLTVMPFKVCGVVGLIFFVPYLAILSVVAVPVIAFYICPSLNLSVRLLIHLFMFMCPRRVNVKVKEWFQKLTAVRQHLNFHEVAANEDFERKHHYSNKGIILQLIVIIMCLVSFWSITLLLMEIISFFVEMFVYTFMGMVVNAGVTLQYVTVLLLVFMYSRNTFSRVYGLYQSYHKVVHKQLMSMARQEVAQVATQEALDQENTAFLVQGDVLANQPAISGPQIRIKNHKPQWLTSGMLVFLDSYDTQLTPEKFFNETVDLKYFGCPGPIYRNVRSAIWEFLKIVLFLLFVFVIVMALGDAYQISTTNQVLATVVGGFLPFIFRHIFTPSTVVDHIDTSSIQFKIEFHKAINRFQQSWPVFDIIPASVREWDPRKIPNKPDQTLPHPLLTSMSVGSSSEDTEEDDDGDLAAAADGDDTDGAPFEGDEVLTKNDSSRFVDTHLAEVDIIVDVSNSETHALAASHDKDFEKGSVSMLDRGQSNNGARTYEIV